jgi:hypothetical protein
MERVFWCALCRQRFPLSLRVARSWQEYFSIADDSDVRTVYLCHPCARLYDDDPVATRDVITRRFQYRFYALMGILILVALVAAFIFFVK